MFEDLFVLFNNNSSLIIGCFVILFIFDISLINLIFNAFLCLFAEILYILSVLLWALKDFLLEFCNELLDFISGENCLISTYSISFKGGFSVCTEISTFSV